MLAVMLLAAYLRIHDLNAQGMWGDEGWSIWLARGDTVRDLTMTMVADHHGPVYSILLRGWDLLAGNSVLALRTITVLFSLASIAMLYRLGSTLFTPAAGVGAALALTLMDKHVVLTQEVRDYPMVFFNMMVIAYFYARWRRTPGRGSAFGFVAATICGLYLHYYCFMVNLAILVHALLTLRGRAAWRHFIALNALITLAFAPWLPIVIHQFVNTPVDSEVLNIHGMPFNRHTLEYLAQESLGTPIALYAMLMLVGWLGPLRTRLPGPLTQQPRQQRTNSALLPVLWFGVPIIITWTLHSRYPLLTDRNISVIMPAIALLVGLGFTAFERFGGAVIVALVVVNGLFTTSSFYDKPPWREMAADIAARHPASEPVLLDVEGAHAAMWYHTLLALDADMDAVVNLLPAEENTPAVVSLYDYRKRYRELFLPYFKSVLDRTDGAWLAYWGDEDKKFDTLNLLEQEGFVRTATLEYEHHGNPIYAHRYDRISALAEALASYGDAITLNKVSWPAEVDSGETFNVLAWWSAAAPITNDYNVSVFLLDANGVLRAQHDGPPANGTAPMSGWESGTFVFDAHPLTAPEPGTYTVGIKLYTWWDGAVLETADGEEFASVGTITVQ